MSRAPVNDGIKAIREKGSDIFRAGPHKMPNIYPTLKEYFQRISEGERDLYL